MEVDSKKMNELGTSFGLVRKDFSISMDVDRNGNLPFVGNFDNTTEYSKGFYASLNAMVQNGQAEILSNPSVLVLNGRQARIQVGQQDMV